MLVAEPSAADLVLTIDKTALNYIFTITDRRTSVIVTSGKCVAVNGRLAAEYLGKEIVKKIRDVRASSDRRHNAATRATTTTTRTKRASPEARLTAAATPTPRAKKPLTGEEERTCVGRYFPFWRRSRF